VEDVMSAISFHDKKVKPNDNLLAEKTGDTYKYWLEIKEHIKEKCGETTEEWKFYGKNYGWQLKTFYKKRNLFFLIPGESSYKIVFIFSDKAVSEIEKSDIAKNLKTTVINAKKYAEGRGLAVEVRDEQYILDIKTLINIKLNN
jgi:hypothetical protein